MACGDEQIIVQLQKFLRMEIQYGQLAKADLAEAITAMPIPAVKAMYWATRQMDAVKKLCGENDITTAEVEENIKEAAAEKDYYQLVLLCITKLIREADEE